MVIVQIGDRYNAPNTMTFMIQSESELNTLPKCASGSVAYINNSDGALSMIWMLDEDGNWNKI